MALKLEKSAPYWDILKVAITPFIFEGQCLGGDEVVSVFSLLCAILDNETGRTRIIDTV